MDKNKQTKKGKFFASRRFRYGAVATVFVVVFIAAVILLNVIVSAIDSKYSLYIDLTQDQVFTIREENIPAIRQLLDDFKASEKMGGRDFTITITFLQARDKLVSNQQSNWVLNLADSYAEAFPEIRVECKEDLLTHPDNYEKYTRLGYTINSSTILVTCSEGGYDVFSLDSCMVYDEAGENLWAFKGEMQFNKAIQKVTAQVEPVAAFTVGHNESEPASFQEVLKDSGFSSEKVDLTKLARLANELKDAGKSDSERAAIRSEIENNLGKVVEVEDDRRSDVQESTKKSETVGISDSVKLLVICNPQTDFLTSDDSEELVTEYSLLSDYLNEYRSVLLIASPGMPAFPVLDELLADWGMEVVRNEVVVDPVSHVPGDDTMLYVEYPAATAEQERVAASITGSLTAQSNPPHSISYRSAPIVILSPGDGETTGTEAVLTSSVNSYVEVNTGDGVERESGPFNLMVVSTRYTVRNNVNTLGHILVIGSDSFTETNTYESKYGNTAIVYNIIRLLSRETIPMETDYKVLEDYAITMKSGDVYTYGIITVIVIPLVIFGFGIAVYLKRKHL